MPIENKVTISSSTISWDITQYDYVSPRQKRDKSMKYFNKRPHFTTNEKHSHISQ